MKNIKKWAAAVPLLGINALICFTRAFGFVCSANFASASELGLYLSLCTYICCCHYILEIFSPCLLALNVIWIFGLFVPFKWPSVSQEPWTSPLYFC